MSHIQSIDRAVKEDYKLQWPVVYALCGIGVVILLFGAGTAVRFHRIPQALFLLAAAGVLVMACRYGLRSALKRQMESQLSWRVTDAGLQRICGEEKPETIRWEQIQVMRWIGFGGLIVLWHESAADFKGRSEWFRSEMRGRRHRELGRFRNVLLVRKEEGDALIAVASSKTGLTAKQLWNGPGIFKRRGVV